MGLNLEHPTLGPHQDGLQIRHDSPAGGEGSSVTGTGTEGLSHTDTELGRIREEIRDLKVILTRLDWKHRLWTWVWGL